MKNSANYVDGFMIPVPKKNLKIYKKNALLCAKVWREHGALEYIECIADDVDPGKITSFPRSVKLKKGEVVILAWITYKSKSHRNQVNSKVMNDPRLEKLFSGGMPFDGMRMIWGGFKKYVSK